MKKLIIIAILGFLAWQGYTKYYVQRVAVADSPDVSEAIDRPTPRPYQTENRAAEGSSAKREQTVLRSHQSDNRDSSSFKCDGRTHCSQMTSCAEATFFLHNCPGVKMDGDNDGIPCEEQWCKNPFSR